VYNIQFLINTYQVYCNNNIAFLESMCATEGGETTIIGSSCTCVGEFYVTVLCGQIIK
jgi:hypothetical protein